MLHEWAGRGAGGFGKPAFGKYGRGTHGKWAHRSISSVRDERTLNDAIKIPILEYYDDVAPKLFDRWLSERNLLGFIRRIRNAPQFHELLKGGLTYHGM